MIRKAFTALVTAALTLSATAALTGCDRNDNAETEPAAEVLGTYDLDGTTYEILTTRCVNDGSYLMFTFSPLPPSAEMTTYVAFGIRTYWIDSEESVTDVSHNDDYIFMYEDPLRFYSQYRRPLDGTFFVGNNGGNNYTVRVDFTLPDGKPFHIDFTGDFE